MDLTPGPPRQAPAEIIMRQLPQGLNFGHLLDISGRAADRLDAEGWLLTEDRREEIRAAAYRAGREDAAKAIEAERDRWERLGYDDGGAWVASVRLAREGQHPRTPGEDVTP